MRIETEYSTYENVYLHCVNYLYNGQLAIVARNDKDGEIAILTVCLDDLSLDDNETYLDTNNCPWVTDFIEQYKIGSLTGKYGKSGYCTYPVARINMDELKKYME